MASAKQQQVLWLPKKGGPYQIAHIEVPRPGPGFVLVKIESCALNPSDNASLYRELFVDKYPYISGNDGSGTVEEVGEGVSELKRGDKVCVERFDKVLRVELKPIIASSKAHSGTTGGHSSNTSSWMCHCLPRFAFVFSLSQVEYWADFRGDFQIPDNLTFDQASTVPLGITTAAVGLYQKRRERGGIGLVAPWADGGRGKYAGQAIYIPGGSSSVGQYGRN